ncbi:Transforming growth factor beta receptor type 3 [Lamellibrachia satsuma]|nr:Transforming growth factor beta receptor type 3 [Lamellibrachia satsuma]
MTRDNADTEYTLFDIIIRTANKSDSGFDNRCSKSPLDKSYLSSWFCPEATHRHMPASLRKFRYISSSRDPYSRRCVIDENFTSPYVSALFERYTIVSGCSSIEVTNTTTPSREVHVINLVNSIPGDSSGTVATPGGKRVVVRLDIKPIGDTAHYDRPLIFVLNSHRQVTWRIRSERLDNTSRHRFWITRNSLLQKEGHMRIKVKKVTLPSETEALLRWVRRKWQAITSFTEVPQANIIIKQIGTESSAPSTCTISSLFNSPTTVAAYLQPQSTRGCVALANRGINNRDVHIIELHSANTSPHKLTAIPDVVVQIRAKVKSPTHHYIVLVLKSHERVKWHINIRGIRGGIDIITDGEVDTADIRLQTVRVAAERLERYSGASLIEWVRDKYGPSVSYTSAVLANRFNLVVDGGDPAKESTDTDGVSRGRVDPFHYQNEVRVALRRSRRVQCFNSGMKVALRKEALKRYGVTKRHLSLRSEDCHARENATHFILETSLSGCGTVLHPDPRTLVFENVVVVRQLNKPSSDGQTDASTDKMEGGSADDSLEVGSGMELTSRDDTFLDDEDYRQANSKILSQFVCGYLPGIAHINLAHPPRKVSVESSIDIYTDETYTEKHTKYPHSVSAKEIVFVETSISADQNFGVLIENCSVASSTSEHSEDRHILISTGCKLDKTVKWHMKTNNNKVATPESDDDTAQQQRFSFKYYRYWEGRVHSYIQCHVVVCSRVKHPTMERCVSRDRYCLTRNMHPKNVPETTFIHTSLLKLAEPELVTWKNTGATTTLGSGTPGNIHDAQDGPTNCVQVVRVQGLDTLTVVGISFAAFIMGVLLTAALWFIHTHTGPMRGRFSRRPRLNETSGESTPSSTAPITIHQVHPH